MSRHHAHKRKWEGTKNYSRRRTRSSGSRVSCSDSSDGASTTDLSTPPRLFPKTTRIEPGVSHFPQIRVRKTRWEPMPEEVLKPDLLKTKTKTKKKKELIQEFHKEKEHFTSLLDFVDNRKQLAVELLSSLDVKTRNKIFPEIKEKNIFEARMLVYDFLRGMSRKRIIAVVKGKDLSDSSSTSDSDDDFSPISSSNSSDSGGSLVRKNKMGNLQKLKSQKIKPKTKLKRKALKKDVEEELEDGEVRSEQEENGIDDDEDHSLSLSSATDEEDEGSSVDATEDDEADLGKDEEPKAAKAKKQLDGSINNNGTNRMESEPQFIISLNFTPPLQKTEGSTDDLNESSENEEEEFVQRVVCILPPSPTPPINITHQTNGGDPLAGDSSPITIEIEHNVNEEEDDDNANINNNSNNQSTVEESCDKTDDEEEEEKEEGELDEDEQQQKAMMDDVHQHLCGDEDKVAEAISEEEATDEDENEEPDIELVE